MDLSQKIPSYLTDKKNITRLILSTALFALVFINIYAPFGIKTFLRISQEWELFIKSSAIVLTGVLVVAISRVIQYHYVKRGHTITVLQYLQWIAIEIVSMALFYTFYEMMYLNEARSVFTAFKKSMLNTSLVLLLPYSVVWLYFSWRDKDKQLQAIATSAEAGPQKLMVPFKDEKGTLRISIKPSDLLYMQGSDNYVTIYYNAQGKPAKFLLRNTLKKLENELEEIKVLRCHRSYMVNIDKVKLVKKDKEGLVLELETIPPIEIPVSKTYMNDVLQAFGHFE
jgi:DNA-binding LytR/AlgR family response regulator